VTPQQRNGPTVCVMHACVCDVCDVCVIRVGVCVICVGVCGICVGVCVICVGVCVHMTTDMCVCYLHA